MFTQRGEDVSELSTHHCAVSFLIEDSQSLNEVLKRAATFGLADVLVYGQELVEVQHLHVHV